MAEMLEEAALKDMVLEELAERFRCCMARELGRIGKKSVCRLLEVEAT